jgi:hypothetical protein
VRLFYTSLLSTYYCRVWIHYWWCIWFYKPTEWWAVWEIWVWNHDNNHGWFRFPIQHDDDSQPIRSEYTAETVWKYVLHTENTDWLQDCCTTVNMFVIHNVYILSAFFKVHLQNCEKQLLVYDCSPSL